MGINVNTVRAYCGMYPDLPFKEEVTDQPYSPIGLMPKDPKAGPRGNYF